MFTNLKIFFDHINLPPLSGIQAGVVQQKSSPESLNNIFESILQAYSQSSEKSNPSLSETNSRTLKMGSPISDLQLITEILDPTANYKPATIEKNQISDILNLIEQIQSETQAIQTVQLNPEFPVITASMKPHSSLPAVSFATGGESNPANAFILKNIHFPLSTFPTAAVSHPAHEVSENPEPLKQLIRALQQPHLKNKIEHYGENSSQELNSAVKRTPQQIFILLNDVKASPIILEFVPAENSLHSTEPVAFKIQPTGAESEKTAKKIIPIDSSQLNTQKMFGAPEENFTLQPDLVKKDSLTSSFQRFGELPEGSDSLLPEGRRPQQTTKYTHTFLNETIPSVQEVLTTNSNPGELLPKSVEAPASQTTSPDFNSVLLADLPPQTNSSPAGNMVSNPTGMVNLPLNVGTQLNTTETSAVPHQQDASIEAPKFNQVKNFLRTSVTADFQPLSDQTATRSNSVIQKAITDTLPIENELPFPGLRFRSVSETQNSQEIKPEQKGLEKVKIAAREETSKSTTLTTKFVTVLNPEKQSLKNAISVSRERIKSTSSQKIKAGAKNLAKPETPNQFLVFDGQNFKEMLFQTNSRLSSLIQLIHQKQVKTGKQNNTVHRPPNNTESSGTGLVEITSSTHFRKNILENTVLNVLNKEQLQNAGTSRPGSKGTNRIFSPSQRTAPSLTENPDPISVREEGQTSHVPKFDSTLRQSSVLTMGNRLPLNNHPGKTPQTVPAHRMPEYVFQSVQKMIHSAQFSLTPRQQQIIFHLQPERLGLIKLQIELKENGLKVKVETSSSESLALLHQNMPQLTQKIQNLGLDIQRFDINLNQNLSMENGFMTEQQNQTGHYQNPVKNYPQKGMENDDPIESQPMRKRWMGYNTIDLIA